MMHLAIIIPDWDSLDSVRRAHSHLEFSALVFFALLVVFEALAHLTEDPRKEKLFDKIGIYLFAVAVLAEIVAYPYGQRNDTLSEKVIGSLDAETKEASGNASKAIKDSGVALGQAEGAQSKAADANKLANGARAEADSFERDIVSAKEESARAERDLASALEHTARLEKQLSWREVTPDQTRSINNFLEPYRFRFFLPPFSGYKIRISYLSGNAEGGEYAEELASALRPSFMGTGIDLEEPTSVMMVGIGPPPTGIVVRVNSGRDPLAILLQNALKTAQIDAPGEIESQAADRSIEIFVALKPKARAGDPEASQQ